MGLLTTYTEPVLIRYKTVFFSRATLFNAFIILTTLIAPYLIAYRTQGLWHKIDKVREQPQVQFKHEALIILDTKSSDKDLIRSSLIWTTIPGLQLLVPEQIMPFILSREGDTNMDGVKDYLDIEITIPLKDGHQERVHGLHLILIFDYRLHKHATLQMETMVLASSQTGTVGNTYELYGDLTLVHKQPLWTHVLDERFNYPVILRNSTNLQEYTLRNILTDYTARNVSTTLKNKYEIWQDDILVNQNEFVIRARIYYTEDSYEAWAGFWNTLKWAWIQYFSILVIIIGILHKFQGIVYKAQLFETLAQAPWKKKSLIDPTVF